MIFLAVNMRKIIALAIYLLAFFCVRLVNRSLRHKLSYLAVFSALSILFNPLVLLRICMLLHLPYAVGGEGVLNGAAGLLALVTGIIAFVHIRNSKEGLQGYPFAIAGIVGGACWLGYWLFVYLRLMLAMDI